MAQVKTALLLLAILFSVSHAFDFGRKFFNKTRNDTNASPDGDKVEPDTEVEESARTFLFASLLE